MTRANHAQEGDTMQTEGYVGSTVHASALDVKDPLDGSDLLEQDFELLAKRVVEDSRGLREPVLYGVSSNEGVLF
jgi:hypothetical protein